MATCKDCIHSGICEVQLEPHYSLDMVQKLMRESNNVEHECLSFKDKSRFVELPCKVGDFVYLVTDFRKIGKYLVTSILIRKTLVDINWRLIDGIGYPTPFARAEEIGKTVFLSREEAERALNGREGEA